MPVTNRSKELDSHELPEPTLLDRIRKIKLNIYKILLRSGLSLSLLGLVACNGTPTPIIDATGTPTPVTTEAPPTFTPEATETPDNDPWPQEGGPWDNCIINLSSLTKMEDDFSTGTYKKTLESNDEPFSFYDPNSVNTTLLKALDLSPGTSEIFMCTFIEKYGQKFLAAISMFGVDENGNLREIRREITIDYSVLNDYTDSGYKTVNLSSSKKPRKNYLV